jgi:cell division protein ZipA
MQISLMLTIILALVTSIYFIYVQYRKRNNQSLLNLSKRLDWVEPVLETADEILPEEYIVEEIMTPILSNTRKKPESPTRKAPLNYGHDILALYIMATDGSLFQGYELLQTISINHFRYGKMQVFHYHEIPSDPNSAIIISLANAVEPGFFNLNEMGTFKTPGLVLFMRLDETEDLTDRFYFMLETAKQLADDLGGEILDDTKQPFNAHSERIYKERLAAIAPLEL